MHSKISVCPYKLQKTGNISVKELAITENHLYAKAYSKGRRYVTPTISVYILPDYAAGRIRKAHPQKLLQNRVGLTVTKKIGGAVTRNRCKRVMREALRSIESKHGLKKGFLCVLVARHDTVKAKTAQVEADMTAAFRALSMLSGMPPAPKTGAQRQTGSKEKQISEKTR